MTRGEWLRTVVVGILTFLTGATVYMWFDTTPPYVLDDRDSHVYPEVAESGMQIRVDWKIRKINRFCGGVNVRILFDARTGARLAIYDPVPVALPYELDRNERLIRTFLLPVRLPPGRVGYRAHQYFACNWLQNFWPLEVVTPDLFFDIVAPGGTDARH